MGFENSNTRYVVDIGNTRIHCGIVLCQNRQCIHRYDFPAEDLQSHLLPALNQLSQRSGIPLSSQVIIGGGTESAITEIKTTLIDTSIEMIRFRYCEHMPFAMDYDGTPGADRIAGILYCTNAFPDHNCITISAGTAITINVLFENVFMGGVIFPGVTTQLKSLPESAPALPLVSPDGPTPLPGYSTETCIRSGILYGISAVIQRIILEYKSVFGTDFTVCATGGDWPYLYRYLDSTIKYDPDMTLTGLALGSFYL